MKETIVMRHNRGMWVKKGDKTKEQLENDFVAEQLKKGYVPSQVRVQELKANIISKITGLPFYDYSRIGKEYDVLIVMGWCGYAGKKQAKEIWYKNKEMLNRENKVISLIP